MPQAGLVPEARSSRRQDLTGSRRSLSSSRSAWRCGLHRLRGSYILDPLRPDSGSYAPLAPNPRFTCSLLIFRFSMSDSSKVFRRPDSGETATPLAVLAERARATGYEPWLFHRDGWDWCWRSWSRVADHVARSVAVLQTCTAEPRRAGYAASQHPDAVTVGLALQASGWVAVPVRGGPREASSLGCGLWAEVGERESAAGIERVGLPSVRSPLERTLLQSLVLERAPGSVRLPGALEVAPVEWMAAAERLDDSLASERGRSIVCAAPDLNLSDTQLLETWTLVRGAAWVLEPDKDAFVETVLWARPTVVWARGRDLELLAPRIGARKHRRSSRLLSIVVAGEEEVDQDPWRKLGIEIVILDEDRI